MCSTFGVAASELSDGGASCTRGDSRRYDDVLGGTWLERARSSIDSWPGYRCFHGIVHEISWRAGKLGRGVDVNSHLRNGDGFMYFLSYRTQHAPPPVQSTSLALRQSELLCHALFRHPPRGSWGPPALHYAALQQCELHRSLSQPLASTLGMLRRIRKWAARSRPRLPTSSSNTPEVRPDTYYFMDGCWCVKLVRHQRAHYP